jgi:hypothetical protein
MLRAKSMRQECVSCWTDGKMLQGNCARSQQRQLARDAAGNTRVEASVEIMTILLNQLYATDLIELFVDLSPDGVSMIMRHARDR